MEWKIYLFIHFSHFGDLNAITFNLMREYRWIAGLAYPWDNTFIFILIKINNKSNTILHKHSQKDI